MKTFQGRVVVPGTAKAQALVTHSGFNTLASYQKSLMFGDKTGKCSDQNNPDLYKKPMAGTALCLPQTIGSTTGGMVLFTAASMSSVLQTHRQPGRRRRHSGGCLERASHAYRRQSGRRIPAGGPHG